MFQKINAYHQLTKPGVTYGNVLTVIAGYFFAVAGRVVVSDFVDVTLGMTLVIASACVLNNYLDQDIDVHMKRTKNRPSARGEISGENMVLFSATLLFIGIALLFVHFSHSIVAYAMAGFITYVWLYGALSKRRSVHGTVVGSISGAIPIFVGYLAGNGGVVDLGAIIVFLILFFWQFPEFYSISIYRRDEYAAAGIPVISVSKGVPATIKQIIVYTVLYVLSTLSVTLAGYAGWVYFVVMFVSGARWIQLAYKGFGIKASRYDAWSKQMFRYSMLAILLLCVMLSVGPVLP